MDLKITEMTKDDIAFAIEMTDIEKWGYLAEDFERLLYFSPSGCFIARERDECVGMITTTACGDFAFVGCLIVPQDHRGKGIGEELMEHAIRYLLHSGITTIELDGVFPAVSLYRRLLFEDKYLSQRFIRPAQSKKYNTRDIVWSADPEIVPFDNFKTTLDRGKILSRYLTDFKNNIAIFKTNEIICGFAVVRERTDDVYAVGPMVADSPEIAGEILRAVISRFGEFTIIAGVPQENSSATGIFLYNGFRHKPAVLRMYRGSRRDYEKHVFAIASPEKG